VVLTVIENQALVWLGAALAPFLPLLGAAANALHFGVQKLLALHCFAPPKKPYSASRTSTIAHGLMLGASVTDACCLDKLPGKPLPVRLQPPCVGDA
jgi:TMC domain